MIYRCYSSTAQSLPACTYRPACKQWWKNISTPYQRENMSPGPPCRKGRERTEGHLCFTSSCRSWGVKPKSEIWHRLYSKGCAYPNPLCLRRGFHLYHRNDQPHNVGVESFSWSKKVSQKWSWGVFVLVCLFVFNSKILFWWQDETQGLIEAKHLLTLPELQVFVWGAHPLVAEINPGADHVQGKLPCSFSLVPPTPCPQAF